MSGFKDWKAGKKVWKAPHVIRYWESITDENQHNLSWKCCRIYTTLVGIALLILGFMIGHMVGQLS